MAVVQSAGALVALQRAPWSWSPSATAGAFTDYAGRTTTYAELYRAQPNVRLVTRFLGRNIAHLGLHAFRRISTTDRERVDSGPLADLIRRPNPRTTRHRFVRGLVEDLAVFDDAYAVMLPNPETGRLSLFRLPPQWVEPIGPSWLFADAYRITGTRDSIEYPAEQVVHLHGHNLDDPRRGSSPLEALRRILAEEAAAGVWREEFWRGSAQIPGYISRPADAPKWSPQARQRFVDGFLASTRAGGGAAGEAPLLEDGMSYHPAGFSPHDAEYLGARKLTREEVAAAYFIPPAFVGLLEHTNFSNMEEQHVSLYADTLGPWLDMITEDLELQLLPKLDDADDVYLEFNLDEKLRGSFAQEAAAASTAVGAPWMSRNELRARRNLPPMPGGDDLVTPLNVLVGGLASPRDTAPPPDSAAPGDTPTGAAARLTGGRKAVGQATRARALEAGRSIRAWDRQHERIIGAFLRRQQSAVLAGLGAGRTATEAFDGTDPDRWNRELAADLLSVSTAMATEVGALAARRFDADFDPEQSSPWLRANARYAADNINATTRSALAEAIHGAPLKALARGLRKYGITDVADDLDADDYDPDIDGDDPLDLSLPNPVDLGREVFEFALGARLAQMAMTRSTSVGNFALTDGARQAGARRKVWIVTSANSRHPEMDGEEVPLGDDFSIGGAWPGAAELPAEQSARCTCVLDFATT